MKLAGGITRAVLLIGPYAIKVPRVRYGWSKFLYGLLSNMTEARFKPLADKWSLAPVVFAVPGGWLNVQRRCEPIGDDDWNHISHDGEYEAMNGLPYWNGMSCDFKRDNFGTLDGRVVLLDYGEVT